MEDTTMTLYNAERNPFAAQHDQGSFLVKVRPTSCECADTQEAGPQMLCILDEDLETLKADSVKIGTAIGDVNSCFEELNARVRTFSASAEACQVVKDKLAKATTPRDGNYIVDVSELNNCVACWTAYKALSDQLCTVILPHCPRHLPNRRMARRRAILGSAVSSVSSQVQRGNVPRATGTHVGIRSGERRVAQGAGGHGGGG
jgi:hypothetical protein